MNNVSNFKSQWTEIRSNSVLFAGYLLGHLHRDKQSVLSKEHISNGMIKIYVSVFLAFVEWISL